MYRRTRHILQTTAALVFLITLATGCNTWKNAESWNYAGVWADDEQSVAAIRSYYQERREIGATVTQTRNHEAQIFTAATDNLSSLTPIGPRLIGRVKELYHMHSSGYLIVGRRPSTSDTVTEGDATYKKQHTYYDKIASNGTISSVASSYAITSKACDNSGGSVSTIEPLQVIPSADGSMLAVVETSNDCNSTSGTLSFRNASDLSVLGDSFTLNLPHSTMPFAFLDLAVAWLESGEFFVGTGAGFGTFTFSGFKYSPNQDPVAEDGLGESCFFPKTTSGWDWRGDLRVRDSGIEIENDPNPGVFGCQ